MLTDSTIIGIIVRESNLLSDTHTHTEVVRPFTFDDENKSIENMSTVQLLTVTYILVMLNFQTY